MTQSLPSLIEFPRDNGRHPDAASDGWYVVCRLEASGRHFGAQAFVLATGSKVRVSTIVRDLETDAWAGQAMVIPLAETTIAQDRLDVRTPISCLDGSIGSEMHFEVQLPESNSVQLRLRPVRPVVHNVGSGCFPLFGARTYQFSLGGIEASGTLALRGESIAVTGQAWYDRQWQAATPSIRPRFDWMGLCLANGATLSVWDTTRGDPNGSAWVTAVTPDGCHTIASISPLSGVASDLQPSDTGAHYPARWMIRIPGLYSNLLVTQRRLRNLEEGSFTGLARVEGTYNGEPTSGYGFVDLVG